MLYHSFNFFEYTIISSDKAKESDEDSVVIIEPSDVKKPIPSLV